MKPNDIAIEPLNVTISTIKDSQSGKFQRDFQKLSNVLPLALIILKEKHFDTGQETARGKRYVPKWVLHLFKRLDDNENPLSDGEYREFWLKVEQLDDIDFKSVKSQGNGLKSVYATFQELSDVVTSLKSYFHVK